MSNLISKILDFNFASIIRHYSYSNSWMEAEKKSYFKLHAYKGKDLTLHKKRKSLTNFFPIKSSTEVNLFHDKYSYLNMIC